MKIEHIYFRWIAAILVAIISWGIFAPMLISSPTDIGLFTGVILVAAVPVFVYWIIRPIYKNKNK